MEAQVDVWGLTVAAFRRWYVLFPLLALSLGAAYMVAEKTQSDYEVTGAVMLVAPADNPVPSNPFAADSGVQILGIKAMSSSTQRSFAAQGLSTEYLVEYDTDTPVMMFSAVGTSEDQALLTGQALVKFLRSTLSGSQEDLGIRSDDRVKITVIDAPDVISPTEGGALRTLAVLGVLGLIASVAVAVVFDAILLRRKSRPTRRRERTDSTSPEPMATDVPSQEPAPTDLPSPEPAARGSD